MKTWTREQWQRWQKQGILEDMQTEIERESDRRATILLREQAIKPSKAS